MWVFGAWNTSCLMLRLSRRYFSRTRVTRSTCGCGDGGVGLPAWPSDKFSEPIDTASRLLQIAPYKHHLLVTTPSQGAWDWPAQPAVSSAAATLNTALRNPEQREKGESGISGKVLVNQISSVVSNTATATATRKKKEEEDGLVTVMHFPRGVQYKVQSTSITSIILDSDGSVPTPIPTRPVILVCAHRSRDSRCGYAGPVLKRHIQTILSELNVDANVMYIDHMGGHKFAGNCIFYIPPPFLKSGPDTQPWSSIWYGRVNLDNIRDVLTATLIRRERIDPLVRFATGQFLPSST